MFVQPNNRHNCIGSRCVVCLGQRQHSSHLKHAFERAVSLADAIQFLENGYKSAHLAWITNPSAHVIEQMVHTQSASAELRAQLNKLHKDLGMAS